MAQEVNAMGRASRCRPSLPLQDICSHDAVPLRTRPITMEERASDVNG
jgi:hypothetical protein